MGTLHSQNFKEWGRRGGVKRARSLSASVRTHIALKAAQSRWGKKESPEDKLVSVRFNQPPLNDLAFLEELLSEGSIEQWAPLYREISNRPFGPVSRALEKVLSFTKIYGATPLWKDLLSHARRHSRFASQRIALKEFKE